MELSTVKRLCTQKVAAIFYETVQWLGEGDRALTDWLEAEKIVEANPNFIRQIAQRAGNISVEEFEQKFGRFLFEWAREFRQYLPISLYGSCMF